MLTAVAQRRLATPCLGELLALAGLFGAPADLAALDCGRCSATGIVACARHKKSEAELERSVVFCSEIAGCAECGGTGWLDCPKCTNAGAQGALAERRAGVEPARKELAWIDEKMGRSVRVAESAHFVLVWELDKHRADKKVRAGHELVHLYLARLEQIFAEYLRVLEVDELQFPAKPIVMVWGEEADQKKASVAFGEVEEESTTAVKRLGAKGLVTLCGVKPSYQDDEQLHRGVAHEVVHLLGAMQKPEGWVGDKQGGWLDEGWAHWFEEHLFGMCENVCYQAYFFREQLDAKDWRGYVLRMVEKDSVPDFATVLFQNSDTMPIEFHAVAFSLVDFLVARGGARFGELFAAVRRRTPARDALQEIYQLSLEDFERDWRAWVRETY